MSKIRLQIAFLIFLVLSLVPANGIAQTLNKLSQSSSESTYIPVQKQPTSNLQPVPNSQPPGFVGEAETFNQNQPSLTEVPVPSNFPDRGLQPVAPRLPMVSNPSDQTERPTLPKTTPGTISDKQFTPTVYFGDTEENLPAPATEDSVSESELEAQINQQGIFQESSGESKLLSPSRDNPKSGVSLSSMKLKPRSSDESTSDSNEGSSGFGQVLTTIGSLILVSGLLIGCLYAMKKFQPKNQQTVPAGVVEILGALAVNSQTQLRVIRFGNKMILVSQSGNHMETLSEITDPTEIDRISGLCHQDKTESSSSSFKNIMKQFSSESTNTTFVDSSGPSEEATDRLRKRLSAVKKS